MRIEYHRTLVADRVRNAAFHAALKAVITPGETVVADVGAGTGLLALMAAGLGAKDVFLYESAEVAGVAAEILKANRARNCPPVPVPFHRDGRPAARRRRRVGDARQLRLRGAHRRDAQRRAAGT